MSLLEAQAIAASGCLLDIEVRSAFPTVSWPTARGTDHQVVFVLKSLQSATAAGVRTLAGDKP